MPSQIETAKLALTAVDYQHVFATTHWTAVLAAGRAGSPESETAQQGKFRAFLLIARKHFLTNEWDWANRQKRGGGMTAFSLDWQNADPRYQIDPTDQLSLDKLCSPTAWQPEQLRPTSR